MKQIFNIITNTMEQNRNNLFNKKDEELIRILARWWNMSEVELTKPFKVIATFKKTNKKDKYNREFGYFEDVRNLNGDLLYYPLRCGIVRIFSEYKEGFMSNNLWQINVKLAPRTQREKFQNPFMLVMENAIVGKPKVQFLDKLKKEKLIRDRFEQTGYTKIDAKNEANALIRLMGDLYTETERFVFELLQNADDQPVEGKLVNVKLKTLDENLLFLHTGKPFTEADVESISSIGDSTKKNDLEKTGYKGIGFKSVFSDAETVYIDSGNFSFAFDKNSPVYPSDANMDEIPWQIKPIWEERYRLPKEIQKEELYFRLPVGIALNVGKEKIATYNIRIPDLLSEPRFTLFLRNINNINFENKNGSSITINKESKDNGIIKIESNEIVEEWITKDYIIDIPEETKDAIQNEKLVPAKLKEATKTKITFAAKIVDGSIIPLDNAVLFTYLPTKVNDFGFHFLVNADFLTTASRESIHLKNIWNRFLFKQIGGLLLDWISSLNDFKGSLCLLPSSIEESENILVNDFYDALKQSLENVAFIKGYKGNMLSIKDVILDKSGLSQIVGKELFCKIVNPSKCLPFDDKDDNILKACTYLNIIEVYKPLSVLENIQKNLLFHEWFIAAEEEKKMLFYNWILNINTEKRKQSIESLVEALPIYRFGDNYLYKTQVDADPNKFVIRSPHKNLESIFKTCGYDCSYNLDELPIAMFYSDKVIKSTFNYILGHLSQRESFFKWLSKAPLEELRILIDWLSYQEKHNHKIIAEFVESLPIIKFRDVFMTKNAIESDSSRIIITNKIETIRPLLNKIGFICSENIEDSPFASLMTHPKEIELFNKIREKINTTPALLSPNEKLELFRVLKQLCGNNDSLVSQICLFSNHTNTHRKWLSIMISYSADLPLWMHNYSIKEKENFKELQQYLIQKEFVFQEIIKKNIMDILNNVALKEVYLWYKNSWTLEFTKWLINKYGTTMSVLDMVEQQDVESKKYFLQQIDRIELNINEIYTSTSFIYRLLSIAFQVLSDTELRVFSSKIWIGEKVLSSFTVSDEISFIYHEGKTIHLPLAKLLPTYNDTEIIEKIKTTLSALNVDSLNRLLSLEPMSVQEVCRKINNIKEYSPYTYLLYIYITRKARNNFNYGANVPNVDLTLQSETWIEELLSILYEQRIELYPDCFGYRLSPYFNNYFSNTYVNEDEKILPSIEKWADTDDKRSYLISLGVKTERTNLIKFRKALINNEPYYDIENIKNSIDSTLEFIKNKNLFPLTGNNQIETMLAIEPYSKKLSIFVDIAKLTIGATEYELPDYQNWKLSSNLRIFIYTRQIPYQLLKTDENNLLVCSFEKNDYYFDSQSKILYINKTCEIRDILYSIVSDSSIPFTSGDWQQLYYDNLVSKEEIENREKEIEKLRNELQEYIDRYGILSNQDIDKSIFRNKDNEEKLNDLIKNSNNEINTPIIKKGDASSLSKLRQFEAQIEAQRFLMQIKSLWQFPPHYGEYNEEGKPYYYSTVEVKDNEKKSFQIVLKSYKKEDEPFKINPEEWKAMIKDFAILLIYTGSDIKRITKEDLIKNQSNISLSFSTKNLDIEERISTFCKLLNYFEDLHFDFKSFNLSGNAESIANIYKKHEGIQNNNTEEDI